MDGGRQSTVSPHKEKDTGVVSVYWQITEFHVPSQWGLIPLSSPTPSIFGLPLTFSSQSSFHKHFDRTIRHCNLCMLQTISTFHLCITYFCPFFSACSSTLLLLGICLGVSLCTFGEKIATLNPLVKQLDLARKLDTVSIVCRGCLLIILSREYRLK